MLDYVCYILQLRNGQINNIRVRVRKSKKRTFSNSKVSIVDTSNPSDLQVIQSFDTVSCHSVLGNSSTSDKDILFVPSLDGVKSFNISNVSISPLPPLSVVQELKLDNFISGSFGPERIANDNKYRVIVDIIEDRYLLVCSSFFSGVFPGKYSGLFIYDVGFTNNNYWNRVGSYTYDAGSFFDIDWASVVGNHIHVIMRIDQLNFFHDIFYFEKIVDPSDGTVSFNITRVKSIDATTLNGGFGEPSGENMGALVVDDELLYWGYQYRGILNISDPLDIKEMGNFLLKPRSSISPKVRSISKKGDILFVLEFEDTALKLFNTSDPTISLPLLGKFDYILRGYDGMVIGDYYYIVDGTDGLKIMDFSDPANIVVIGRLDTEDARYIQYDGESTIIIGDFRIGIKVVDIYDPKNPVQLSSIEDTEMRDIFLRNNHLFVARGERGIAIFEFEKILVGGKHFSTLCSSTEVVVTASDFEVNVSDSFFITQEDFCNGHGTCLPDTKCDCSEGYVDEFCAGSYWYCNNILHTSSNVCGGKGKCSGLDRCDCEETSSTGNVQTGKFCEIKLGKRIIKATNGVFLISLSMTLEDLEFHYSEVFHNRTHFPCRKLLVPHPDDITSNLIFSNDTKCGLSSSYEETTVRTETQLLKVFLPRNLIEENLFINEKSLRVSIITSPDDIQHLEIYPKTEIILAGDSDEFGPLTMRVFSPGTETSFNLEKSQSSIQKCKQRLFFEDICVEVFQCYKNLGNTDTYDYFSLGFVPSLLTDGYLLSKFYFSSELNCELGSNFIEFQTFSMVSCSGSETQKDYFRVYRECESRYSDIVFNSEVLAVFFGAMTPMSVFMGACFLCCIGPVLMSCLVFCCRQIWGVCGIDWCCRRRRIKKMRDRFDLSKEFEGLVEDLSDDENKISLLERIKILVYESAEREEKELKSSEEGLDNSNNNNNNDLLESEDGSVESVDDLYVKKEGIDDDEKNDQDSVLAMEDFSSNNNDKDVPEPKEEYQPIQEYPETNDEEEENAEEEATIIQEPCEQPILVEKNEESSSSSSSSSSTSSSTASESSVEEKEGENVVMSSAYSNLNPNELLPSSQSLTEQLLEKRILDLKLELEEFGKLKGYSKPMTKYVDVGLSFLSDLHNNIKNDKKELKIIPNEKKSENLDSIIRIKSGRSLMRKNISKWGYKLFCFFQKVNCCLLCCCLPAYCHPWTLDFFKCIMMTFSVLCREGLMVWFSVSEFLSTDDIDPDGENFIIQQTILSTCQTVIWIILGLYIITVLFFMIIYIRILYRDPVMFCIGYGSLKEYVYYRIMKSSFLLFFFGMNLCCFIVKYMYLDSYEQSEVVKDWNWYFSILFPQLLLFFSIMNVLSYNGVVSHPQYKKLKSLGECFCCHKFYLPKESFLCFPRVKVGWSKVFKESDAILEDFFQLLFLVHERAKSTLVTNHGVTMEESIRFMSSSEEYAHLSWDYLDGLTPQKITYLKEFFFPDSLYQESFWNIFHHRRILSFPWLATVCCFPLICFFGISRH